MPSKSKSVREAQKEYYETAISKRRAALKEQGLDNDRIQKDPKLKKLKASLRQVHGTLDAIAEKAKLNELLAQRKKEKAEKPPEEKKKGKRSKKKDEPVADKASKSKKDKKKK